MLYRCVHCLKTCERESSKKWVKSYCEKTQRIVHLQEAEYRLPKDFKEMSTYWYPLTDKKFPTIDWKKPIKYDQPGFFKSRGK